MGRERAFAGSPTKAEHGSTPLSKWRALNRIGKKDSKRLAARSIRAAVSDRMTSTGLSPVEDYVQVRRK